MGGGVSLPNVKTGFAFPLHVESAMLGSGDKQNVAPLDKQLSDDMDRHNSRPSCVIFVISSPSSSDDDESSFASSGCWLPMAPIIAKDVKLDMAGIKLLRRLCLSVS